jgi:hypothetical protein
MTKNCSEIDWLLLSRYLARGLPTRQVAELVNRLSREPELNEALIQLKRTRVLLSYLPEKQVPHNFTIKAGMMPKKSTPRLFPVFRVATAVSTFLFAVVLGLRTFLPGQQNAPGMLMAMSAVSQESTAEDNSAQVLAPKAAPIVEPTIEVTPDVRAAAGAGVLTGSMPTQEATAEAVYAERQLNPEKEVIPWSPIAWGLGIISLVLGILALYIYFQERV